MIESFDYIILSFYHYIAVLTNNSLTSFIRAISYLCDAQKGFPIVIIAVLLMIYKKTRKIGLVMLLSMLVGLLVTNLAVKNLVARLRPYQASTLYYSWWQYVGSTVVSEFSFPSGHMTSITAAMMSIIYLTRSKLKYLSLILIVLMGVSRNYLMVHYPTDVIGGFMVGFISATVVYLLMKKYIFTHEKWNQYLGN